MNNKKFIIIFVLLFVIIVLFIYFMFLNKITDNKIPDNYIAIFNGGSGEVTYSTYIYKVENGQENYGFKYINTVNTTVSWGSPEWEIKVVGRGTVNWTQEVFDVAMKNNAYSYVLLPNDSKIYSIEEFKLMFEMK